MKKLGTLLLILLFIFLFGFSQTDAADISIGAFSWYAWWDWDMAASPNQSSQKYKFDPSFLYGPVLSLKFSENWSLSSVFLYGKYDTPDDAVQNGWPSELARYDSDTALNYSISRYFKLFAGFKYMGYKFTGGSHYAYGSGMGIGFTLPLSSQLFFLGNLSGLYLKGEEKYSDSGGGEDKSALKETGFNTNASLAYYIDPLTISLGFRYQQFSADYDDQAFQDFDTRVYGATLSVIYSFDI